jgi:hypothetical protein
VHITEDLLDRKKVPDLFAEFLTGREPASVNMQKDSCGEC